MRTTVRRGEGRIGAWACDQWVDLKFARRCVLSIEIGSRQENNADEAHCVCEEGRGAHRVVLARGSGQGAYVTACDPLLLLSVCFVTSPCHLHLLLLDPVTNMHQQLRPPSHAFSMQSAPSLQPLTPSSLTTTPLSNTTTTSLQTRTYTSAVYAHASRMQISSFPQLPPSLTLPPYLQWCSQISSSVAANAVNIAAIATKCDPPWSH